MYYALTALKETQGRTITLPCVILEEDRDALRAFLQMQGFIILSVNKFEGEASQLSDFWATIRGDQRDFTLTVQTPNLRQLAQDLAEAGLTIAILNSYAHPLPAESITAIITEATQQVQMIRQAQEQKAKAEEAKKEAMYSDADLAKTKTIIDNTLLDIQALKTKTQGIADGKTLKNLEENEDELKKLRMWSNQSKIAQILEKTFLIMEEMEFEYLEYMRKGEYRVLNDSLVSNVDVIDQMDQFDTAHKIEAAGVTKSYNDQYYLLLGKSGMFARFFGKDFTAKIAQIVNILSTLLDFVEYTLIMILLTIGALLCYKKIFLTQVDTDPILTYNMVLVGSAGFVAFILQLAKKRNTVWLLTLFIVGVLGYIGFRSFIDSNFAFSF